MDAHLRLIRRLSAVLFVCSALVVALIIQLPGVDHGHRASIEILLALAALAGVAVWLFPWEHFNPNLYLVAGVTANVMVALLIYWTGGPSSIFFPIYVFIVVAAGAYFRTLPLAFITALSCLSAASFLSYTGPLALAIVVPLLGLLPVLVAVAIVCNVLYRGLERNVLILDHRARFIEALHQIDQAMLNEVAENEILGIAAERTRTLLDCEKVHIEVGSDAADAVAPLRPFSSRQIPLRVPLVAAGESLGSLLLVWRDDQQVSPETIALVRNLAAQIALAIHRGRLRHQVEQARALGELNRLKDEFISTASHELRTPLTSIVGFTEILSQGRVSPEKAASIYPTLYRSAQQLSNLVDDLLDVSRLESGQLQLNPEPRDLGVLARQVAAELSAASKKHELVVRTGAEPAIARVDERRIHQVLVNLIANAFRYSPNGGTVTIEVHPEGEDVVVSVSDEGIGIPPGVLGQLFENFYRAPNATPDARATGLGLALCRGLIEAHGGRIWAESKGEGQGSRFVFVLPRVGYGGEPRA